MNFELGAHVQFFPNNMECFSIELCVRGYHTYKEIWKVNVGEQLPCQCENGNCADQFVQVVFERYWPQFIVHVSVFNPLFTSSPTHARQLKKRDPMDIGHCQQEADSEHSST